MDNTREKYVPREEDHRRRIYKKIIQFEAEIAEKKEIIIKAKTNDPNKKLTKDEIKIIFHPLLISSEQKYNISWLRKKGNIIQVSVESLDLSEDLYSLWIEENSFTSSLDIFLNSKIHL